MALLMNRIICGNCENVFVRKMERGKFKWFCPRFDDSLSCKCIVDEERMTEFLSRRLWLEERTFENVKNFIESKVERIEVIDSYDFICYIKGQESMHWKPGGNIKY